MSRTPRRRPSGTLLSLMSGHDPYPWAASKPLQGWTSLQLQGDRSSGSLEQAWAQAPESQLRSFALIPLGPWRARRQDGLPERIDRQQSLHERRAAEFWPSRPFLRRPEPDVPHRAQTSGAAGPQRDPASPRRALKRNARQRAKRPPPSWTRSRHVASIAKQMGAPRDEQRGPSRAAWTAACSIAILRRPRHDDR